MNWSLVPLMGGAIAFGYLGYWLQGRLSSTLGDTEALPGPITVVGLVAFALGQSASAWPAGTSPGNRRQPKMSKRRPIDPTHGCGRLPTQATQPQ